MTVYLVTLIVILVITTLQIIGRRKKDTPNSVMDELNSIPEFQNMKGLYDLMQTMSEDGTNEDTIPEGYGEFGYELSNPIPVNTTFGIISYLGKLKTLNNVKVTYERIGSFRSPISKHLVDGYQISLDGEDLAILYISCYHKKNSEKAPKNFKF